VTAIWLIAGVVVPWAAGAALVGAFVPTTRRFFRASSGFLVGQVLVIAWLYGAFRLAGGGYSHSGLVVMGLAALVFTGLRRIRHTSPPPESPASHRLLAALAVAGIMLFAIRLYGLTQSTLHIPIRGEDAHAYWLFKARVITELDRIPTDPNEPYYLGGSNPAYPVFPSLIAAWLPMVNGGWSERLAVVPWLLFYLNLFVLILAGLAHWMSRANACLIACATTSMPLLVIHVYRPGYADLLLAAFLAGAVMNAMIWRATGERRYLLLSGILAVAAALMKREGPAVAGAAVIALLVPTARSLLDWPRRAKRIAALLALVACIVVATLMNTADLRRDAAALEYHPEVWNALARHLFTWSSFHMTFWLIPPAIVALLCLPRTALTWPTVALTVVLLGLWAAIFVLTPNAKFALNDQTPSRSALQIAPALIIAVAAAFGEAARTRSKEKP